MDNDKVGELFLKHSVVFVW